MDRILNSCSILIPADEDLFVVEQHAVDLLDGVNGGLLSLEVNEAVALRY